MQSNKIREILEILLNYYHINRGAGHTTTMLKGALNTDCLILTPTLRIAEQLNKQFRNKIEAITIHNLGKLRGQRKPLALDNSALYELFLACVSEIDSLEKELQIEKLKSTLKKKE